MNLRSATVLKLEKVLTNENQADVEITEDFIDTLTRYDPISSRWPLLASLLSFNTAEIEQIKREVVGIPSVKAAAMMNRWKERTIATYGTFLSKVSQFSTRCLQENKYRKVCINTHG